MNKRRRDNLKKAESYIEMASDIIEGALEEEEDCYENIPESLQESDRGEKMEEAISNLEDALDCIETLRDKIESARG